jgi:hypothetical protein
VVGVALAGLACALGPSTPEGKANRAACEAYVEKVNSLGSCVEVSYDPSNLCEGADALPAEMAAYYDCLRTSSRCDGADAKIGEGCTAPLVALVPPAQDGVTMDAGGQR